MRTCEGSDTEATGPRRLVKPRTNKSSSNLRLRALQESEGKVKSNSTSDLPLTPPAADGPSRTHIKEHVIEHDVEYRVTRSLIAEPSEWKGVALLVNSIEARQTVDNGGPSDSVPKKAKRPFSSIFGSRRPSSTSVKTMSTNNSRDCLQLQTPTSSNAGDGNTLRDTTPDLTPTRLQRPSSYVPGVATRQNRPQDKETTIPELLARLEETHEETSTGHPRPSLDDWIPPPRITRPETPSDLEAPQLGGLLLGSLKIMNGRASPAPSELSRHLVPKARPQLKRDNSSDYGDIENAGQFSLASPTTSATAVNTTATDSMFGLSTQTRQRSTDSLDALFRVRPSGTPVGPPIPNSENISRRKPLPGADETLAIANEYIAEMPDSPFTPNEPISEPHLDSSPKGSVIITSKANEMDDHLFDDEGVGSLCSAADRTSMDSFYSVVEPKPVKHERFESAVEFQPSPSFLKHRSMGLAAPENHDSGYSSNASTPDDASEILNLGAENVNAPLTLNQAATQPESLTATIRPRAARPVSILKQNRVTAPELPTFASLRPAMSSNTSMSSFKTQSDVPPQGASTSPKKARKLQKRRPLSQPLPIELIPVQGAYQDIDAAVPPIPPEILYNLNIRTREFPELRETFKTMEHTKRQSISSFSINMPDIRFPSPNPEIQDDRLQRRVALGRRKSFLNKIKTGRRASGQAAQEELTRKETLEVLGGYSPLGASPYDAIRPQQSSFPNPDKKFAQRPKLMRPRSMMDDETATQVARLRSHAAAEREFNKTTKPRSSSFNTRGGRQGMQFALVGSAWGAPPLPPVPSSNPYTRFPQLTHPSEQQNLYPVHPESQHQVQYAESHYGEPAYFQEDHSRPAHYQPYGPRAADFAPPPPSHSPRPVLISAAQSCDGYRPGTAPFHPSEWRPPPSSSYGRDMQGPREEPLYPEIPPRQTRGHVYSPPFTKPLTSCGPRTTVEWEHSSQRTLPIPPGNSYWATQIERPRSRNSQISNAGSLADSLHPTDLERVQPAPEFGRYSGGMNYGYERGAGFSGSAGTRSCSGKADGSRKGVALRASHGVDLGDIPVMATYQPR